MRWSLLVWSGRHAPGDSQWPKLEPLSICSRPDATAGTALAGASRAAYLFEGTGVFHVRVAGMIDGRFETGM